MQVNSTWGREENKESNKCCYTLVEDERKESEMKIFTGKMKNFYLSKE